MLLLFVGCSHGDSPGTPVSDTSGSVPPANKQQDLSIAGSWEGAGVTLILATTGDCIMVAGQPVLGQYEYKDGHLILDFSKALKQAGNVSHPFGTTDDRLDLSCHTKGSAEMQLVDDKQNWQSLAPSFNLTLRKYQDKDEADKLVADAKREIEEVASTAVTEATGGPSGSTSGGSISSPLGSKAGSLEDTGCAINLKELDRSLSLYAADFDGSYPDSSKWSDSLAPYTARESAYTCPSLVKEGGKYGYAMSTEFSGVRASGIADPVQAILLYESSNLAANASDRYTSLLQTPRHLHVWIAYADGHVRHKKDAKDR